MINKIEEQTPEKNQISPSPEHYPTMVCFWTSLQIWNKTHFTQKKMLMQYSASRSANDDDFLRPLSKLYRAKKINLNFITPLPGAISLVTLPKVRGQGNLFIIFLLLLLDQLSLGSYHFWPSLLGSRVATSSSPTDSRFVDLPSVFSSLRCTV